MLDLRNVENLAITGANGFVGRSITDRIANLDVDLLPKRITLVTRTGLNYVIPRKLHSIVRVVTQDLTAEWHLPVEISHVISLAADGSQQPYSELACEQFTQITRNLVTWLEKANRNVTIFHASSGACFGYKALSSGVQPPKVKQLFTENRLNAENYLKESQARIKFDLRIGRLFSFSGKNIMGKPQYAISSFVSSAVKFGTIDVAGNPDTQRSYLHESSMSEWILEGLINPYSYQDLQIGSSDVLTIRELADFIAENTGSYVKYPSNPLAGDIYIPDNRDTLTKLGVVEGLSWREAVVEMISIAKVYKDGS